MNRTRTAVLVAAMTALFVGVGLLLGGRGGAMAALLLAAAINLVSWWNADRMVLRLHGAREVDAQTAPDYHRIVADLAARAGLPMPRVALIDADQPNAFATGRNPANATVAVTTGLLRRLTPDELAGVVAHELTHIENRDTLLMTITATLAGAVSMLGNFAFLFGGHRGANGGGSPFGTLLAVLVAPLAAGIVQMAISRTREYAADRRGAEISGRPLSLASALAKIAGTHALNPDAERNPATAHLFIVNPLSGRHLDGLFSTHPATADRIAAPEAMDAERAMAAPLGRSVPAVRRLSGPWG